MPLDDRDASPPPTSDTADMPRRIVKMRDVVTIVGCVVCLVVFVSYKLNLWLTPPAQQLSAIFVIACTAACAIFFYIVVFWAIRKSQLRDSLVGRLALTGMVCLSLHALHSCHRLRRVAVVPGWLVAPRGDDTYGSNTHWCRRIPCSPWHVLHDRWRGDQDCRGHPLRTRGARQLMSPARRRLVAIWLKCRLHLEQQRRVAGVIAPGTRL